EAAASMRKRAPPPDPEDPSGPKRPGRSTASGTRGVGSDGDVAWGRLRATRRAGVGMRLPPWSDARVARSGGLGRGRLEARMGGAESGPRGRPPSISPPPPTRSSAPAEGRTPTLAAGEDPRRREEEIMAAQAVVVIQQAGPNLTFFQ